MWIIDNGEGINVTGQTYFSKAQAEWELKQLTSNGIKVPWIVKEV